MLKNRNQFKLDYQTQILHVSKIFKWFREDFGGDGDQIFEHIRRYAADELKEKIPASGRIKVKYEYDWSLNDLASFGG